MSQNDMVIANADGATVRADINSALAAMVGMSSGVSAPTATFAYMLWADTGNALIKQRNAADSAWITIANIGSTLAEIATAQTFSKRQSGSITGLTDGASIAVDMSLNNHFSVTIAGNRTLVNPSNIVAGTSGSFFITQDGTGSRTLSYGTYYDFGGGTAPTLTTTAGAKDRIDYIARTTTSLHCVWSGDLS